MAEYKIYISRMLNDLTNNMASMSNAMDGMYNATQDMIERLVHLPELQSQIITSLKVKPSNDLKDARHFNTVAYTAALAGGISDGAEQFFNGYKYKSLADGSVTILFTGITHGRNQFPDSRFAVKVGDTIYKSLQLNQTAADAGIYTEPNQEIIVPVAYGDIIDIGWWGRARSGSEGTFIYNLNIPIGGVSILYEFVDVTETGGFTPILTQ